MNRPITENRLFDEIELGQRAELSRKLTEDDITLFSRVSGNLNPLHSGRGPGPHTVHAQWSSSIISGLLGNALPGPGTALQHLDVDFLKSVSPGDTVKASIEVIDKRAPDRIVFACRVELSSGEPVMQGRAEVIAPAEKLRVELTEPAKIMINHHDSFAALEPRIASIEPIATAVVHPCDRVSLEGALEAAEDGIIRPILVGPSDKIVATADDANLDIRGLTIIDAEHSHDAAFKAVGLVQTGEAHLLMKGSLHSDELLDAVVDKVKGIRTERRISHVFVMDVPTYPKLLLVTDAGVNIAPGLDAKRDICQNAINLALALGVENPKVAILSAVETVRSKIPSTVDAAALCKMADRGQITGGVLDGPLAMDNAINLEAARIKGIVSPVAGQADILVAPDLEAGNILAKQLTFLANADAAGVVVGARVPVILTSRADTVRTRRASAIVAALYAQSLIAPS